MDLVVTGRVTNGSNVTGYKVWKINSNNIIGYMYVTLESVNELSRYGRLINCKIGLNGRLRSLLKIPIAKYPKYDKNFRPIRCLYTDSDIIALAYNVDVESVRLLICEALIQGAISDPDSEMAEAHVELYYEETRHRSDDIEKIARNLNISKNDALQIKNYLFMDYHDLETGYKRFDPNFHIAQSWQGLCDKDATKIQEHDITLIKHEIFEMKLVNNGVDQNIKIKLENISRIDCIVYADVYSVEEHPVHFEIAIDAENKKVVKNTHEKIDSLSGMALAELIKLIEVGGELPKRVESA